jgi:prepilin-type N-terminal cleavage/methylation domain-containing protein
MMNLENNSRKTSHKTNLCSRGFTLIELMMVIAIIAIIAAIAIPNLISARMAGNETSAIGSMKTISTSEALFSQRHREYGTLDDLYNDGLIDADLKDGEKNGYLFECILDAGRQGFRCDAEPANGNSGSRHFYTTHLDDNVWIKGTIHDSGDVPVPPVGPLPEVGTPTPEDEIAAALLDNIVIATLEDLFQLDRSNLESGVRNILGSYIKVQRILEELDSNGDGSLSFSEILSADVLSIARTIKGELIGPDYGGSLGSDSLINDIVNTYLGSVDSQLEIGIANESTPPQVLIEDMTGDPLSLLDRVVDPILQTARFNWYRGEGCFEVQFDASENDGTAYAWSFGEGGTGSGEMTSHNYPSKGTYLVTLTVDEYFWVTKEVTISENEFQVGKPVSIPRTVQNY